MFHYSYFRILWQVGWSGVDLFFVLSGFLVSGLLFEEYKRRGRIDPVRFWVRRGFKIYPVFYLFMAYSAIVLAVSKNGHELKILSEVFFLQNYLPRVWPHTWSLAVEEHFYLALPLMLLLLAKRKKKPSDPFRRVPVLFCAVALICLGARILESLNGVSINDLHTQTHLRIDSLLAGVAISYYRHFKSETFEKIARTPLWVPGALLLIPCFFLAPGGRLMNTVGLTLTYAGYGCILIWTVDKPRSVAALPRALAWVGRYSYPIYVWHIAVWLLVVRTRVTIGSFVIGVTASIVLGAVVSKVVEFPGLQLRDKLFPAYGTGAPSSTNVVDQFPAQIKAT